MTLFCFISFGDLWRQLHRNTDVIHKSSILHVNFCGLEETKLLGGKAPGEGSLLYSHNIRSAQSMIGLLRKGIVLQLWRSHDERGGMKSYLNKQMRFRRLMNVHTTFIRAN